MDVIKSLMKLYAHQQDAVRSLE